MAPPEKVNERWVCLFGSRHLYKAEILKALLNEHDISSVIINKQDSAYLFGDIELYVILDDILKAQQVLETFLKDE